MTIALYCLLAFATWTLGLLAATIGVHRWNLILRGQREIHTFRADASDGPDWYRRATRAHLNCVENLPVFAAIVVTAALAGLQSPWFDLLACVVVVARVLQTLTHVSFRESARSVSFRFSFFMVQVACMFALIVLIVMPS
jgi:uncharacterized MAPEG superfamily protein